MTRKNGGTALTGHELVVDHDQKCFRCICGIVPQPMRALTANLEDAFRQERDAIVRHVEQANKSDAAFERVAAEHRLEQERR